MRSDPGSRLNGAGERMERPDCLTLDRIFHAEEFKEQEVPPIQWSRRRGGYTCLEKPAKNEAGQNLVWHDAASRRREILVPARRFVPPGEDAPLRIESYTFSADESRLLLLTNGQPVWRARSRGDYWLLDIPGGEMKKLGGDAPPSALLWAKFSPDGRRIAFVRENNLYVQDLQDFAITPLTTDGSPKRMNGTFDRVYETDLGLHDGFRWSPDGGAIAYWQIDTEAVREFCLISNTNGLYSTVQPISYPKVGERNPSARIGVVSAAGGETHWLPVPGDPGEHFIVQMDWAGGSDEILLQQFNRLQNTHRLMRANVRSHHLDTLLTETDAAWVENANGTLRWLDGAARLAWLSEREGWRHIDGVFLPDGQRSPITQGSFDVISVEGIDRESGWLYYLASPGNPTQRYLYRVRFDGERSERLTPPDTPGTHVYSLSPDAKWAIHTYSTFSNPPVTELISMPDHRTVDVLAANRELKRRVARLKQPSIEFFRVDIGDGVLLDAWCLTPPDLDPALSYPALFYVYGGPAAQTVMDRWGGHLWHWMLAQQGYVVISVDNRGTPAPRGREWRKSIHRQVGILVAADQAAAVRAILQERPFIDPLRIATWGWSAGGSMTLNALFRYPDLYHTGIAVAPVPNLLYNGSVYQERHMGSLEDNAEGYRQCSPITYAHQLKGDLLLIHGTGDDNCHYQGTEALINELITHNKQFEMFSYPGRSHNISEGGNTRRHLYGLMTRFLNERLPPGPRPRGSPDDQPHPQNKTLRSLS